jgi:hypothetical protein
MNELPKSNLENYQHQWPSGGVFKACAPKFFRRMRQKPRKVLEIPNREAASTKVWKEIFVKGP